MGFFCESQISTFVRKGFLLPQLLVRSFLRSRPPSLHPSALGSASNPDQSISTCRTIIFQDCFANREPDSFREEGIPSPPAPCQELPPKPAALASSFGARVGFESLYRKHFSCLPIGQAGEMAERKGFEPLRPCGLLAFQASALDRAMRPLHRSLRVLLGHSS